MSTETGKAAGQPDYGKHNDRRHNLRGNIDLAVEIRQGGSVWHQRLVDISLVGLATDQPDVWDAQYNEPFTLKVTLEDGRTLSLHAYLQHVESGRLGFSVPHVDQQNIRPLRELLETRVEDASALEVEINSLQER
jgi:hypothetical protein